jgi:hypothetical protein
MGARSLNRIRTGNDKEGIGNDQHCKLILQLFGAKALCKQPILVLGAQSRDCSPRDDDPVLVELSFVGRRSIAAESRKTRTVRLAGQRTGAHVLCLDAFGEPRRPICEALFEPIKRLRG